VIPLVSIFVLNSWENQISLVVLQMLPPFAMMIIIKVQLALNRVIIRDQKLASSLCHLEWQLALQSIYET